MGRLDANRAVLRCQHGGPDMWPSSELERTPFRIFFYDSSLGTGCECSRSFLVISLHSLVLVRRGRWVWTLKGRKRRQLHSILENSGYDNGCSTRLPNALRRTGR